MTDDQVIRMVALWLAVQAPGGEGWPLPSKVVDRAEAYESYIRGRIAADDE